MASVMSAITNTVPITRFHRGPAGKIFDEVRQCGAKIVMKNSAAECVLISVHADEELYKIPQERAGTRFSIDAFANFPAQPRKAERGFFISSSCRIALPAVYGAACRMPGSKRERRKTYGSQCTKYFGNHL